eukprot:CAMPEP_0201519786 /NCGR_PEP_ID=MMETSP0161_2-20130828/10249_1 /ASSEMBLY_ACC=CAM_ASM_000251 /TAXON_ID=180227 /ORGANISM="Neoparamoeba aestuarina, Strain SoJaBio B1-5/56/2" /LENGTH=507 /DNA_ID=CAMNT_0047917937 /DNA_START=117 /DNA_END=1637 /DNA_ORIENTATION=+
MKKPIKSMTVADLREELKSRGLSTKGLKAELLSRLMESEAERVEQEEKEKAEDKGEKDDKEEDKEKKEKEEKEKADKEKEEKEKEEKEEEKEDREDGDEDFASLLYPTRKARSNSCQSRYLDDYPLTLNHTNNGFLAPGGIAGGYSQSLRDPQRGPPQKRERRERSGTILEEIVQHSLRKLESDKPVRRKPQRSLPNFPNFDAALRMSGSDRTESPPSQRRLSERGMEEGGDGRASPLAKKPRTGYGLRTDLEMGENADNWMETKDIALSAVTAIQGVVFHHYPFLRKKKTRLEVTYHAILEFVFEKTSPEMMGFYYQRWKGADDHLSEMWDKFEKACGGVSPAHLGLPKQLWLYDPWSDAIAYSSAISRLRKIDEVYTAKDKLSCLVDVGNLIFKALEKYWNSNESGDLSVMVGGDELLPLFMYVIIKAKVKKGFSQSYFMQDFIDDQCSIQKEGYLLATFQTAIALLANETDPEELAKRGEDAKRRQQIKREEKKPPPLDDDASF